IGSFLHPKGCCDKPSHRAYEHECLVLTHGHNLREHKKCRDDGHRKEDERYEHYNPGFHRLNVYAIPGRFCINLLNITYSTTAINHPGNPTKKISMPKLRFNQRQINNVNIQVPAAAVLKCMPARSAYSSWRPSLGSK